MKLSKNKKGVEIALQTIVVAILVLMVVIVSISLYTKYINKSTGQIDDNLDKISDYDNDGTLDLFDPCPCDADTTKCNTDAEVCKENLAKKNE